MIRKGRKHEERNQNTQKRGNEERGEVTRRGDKSRKNERR